MKIMGLGLPELVIMIAPFLLAIIPAKIAERKGRSFAGFYVFGLLLWPIALIVSLVIGERR